MHKCQHRALLAFRFPASHLPARRIDHCRAAGSRGAIALRGCRHLGRRPAQFHATAARPGGRTAAIQTTAQNAERRFTSEGAGAALQPLVTGLRAVRGLRAQLRNLTIDEGGRFEIDFRLRQKEREFQQAILLANGVRVEALADDGVVVPGQPVRVSVVVANRGAADVTVKQVNFSGFDAGAPCTLTAVVAGGRGRGGAPAAPATPISTLRKDQAGTCEPTLTVPMTARTTEPYWHREGEAGRYTFDADAPFGLPYRPTPFTCKDADIRRRRRSDQRAARPVSISSRRVQRGEAVRRAGRAGVVGTRLTGDCHSACVFRPCVGARAGHAAGCWRWPGGRLSGPWRPGCGAGPGVRCPRRRARPARNSRHRHQRREGGIRRRREA